MQLLDWNGVHRRNMSPTVTPGAPAPVRFTAPPQEPVRSGFPLASLGVGAFGSAGGRGAPNCAANGATRTPSTIATMIAFIALLTFQPSAHCPEQAR